MTQKETNDWNRFVREGLHDPDQSENGMNTVHDFVKMTKVFGRPYLEYLAASYACKDTLTDLEWANLNGKVPASFIESKVKSSADQLEIHVKEGGEWYVVCGGKRVTGSGETSESAAIGGTATGSTAASGGSGGSGPTARPTSPTPTAASARCAGGRCAPPTTHR